MKPHESGSGRTGLPLSVCIVLLAAGAQAEAGVVTTRTASCAPDGDTPLRHILLREHTDSDVLCDVLYAKPDEGGSVDTMWTARNDAGFCAARFGDFIERHRVEFEWHCSESGQVAGGSVVPDDAPERALPERTVSASTSGSIRESEASRETSRDAAWRDAPDLASRASSATGPSGPDAEATSVATSLAASIDPLDGSVPASDPFPDEDPVSRQVMEIAIALERQKIGYNTEDLSDCSGVFHRVLMNLQREYPTITLPKPTTHRSTRKLARWYHERGSLEVVRSAADEDDAIRPGVVLFYGQRGKRYDDATPEELFEIGSGIAHMGVVVGVERVDGRVLGYSLFHGRRTGTDASITRYHRRAPSRANHPPYGNGDEHWVAYSPILPPATPFGEDGLIAENTGEAELVAENTEEP